MSQFLLRTIGYFYEKIFGEKMGEDAKKFLKDLVYLTVGIGIASGVAFIFNVVAGRLLGPSGYGEFTLVQSIAMFLCIPMMLGISTALVKYNAESDDLRRQCSIISTSFIMVLMFSTSSAILYFILSPQLSSLFSVSEFLFYLSIIFAVVFVLYTMTTNALRSQNDMKKYAIYQMVYAVVLLIAILCFAVNTIGVSVWHVLIAMYSAYGVVGIGLLVLHLKKYIRLKIDKEWSQLLLIYGSWGLAGGVASAFYSNIDKVLINKYMAIADVGVYKVYYFSFISIIAITVAGFITAFFPMASRYKDKSVILGRVEKLTPYIILIGFPIVVGAGVIVFKFFGAQYPFDAKLALLFGIAGILICLETIYGWLMNSVGIQGIKITTFAAIVLAVANTSLNIWLIPLIGIEGAIVALIISFAMSLIIILSKRKYIKSKGAV